MILNKIAEAVREQDWFIVVLEVLIVVTGIFIGRQVDDWNHARLDQREASYHLNFSYDELLEAITLADAEIEQSKATLQNSFPGKPAIDSECLGGRRRSTFQGDGLFHLSTLGSKKPGRISETSDRRRQTETPYGYSLVFMP